MKKFKVVALLGLASFSSVNFEPHTALAVSAEYACVQPGLNQQEREYWNCDDVDKKACSQPGLNDYERKIHNCPSDIDNGDAGNAGAGNYKIPNPDDTMTKTISNELQATPEKYRDNKYNELKRTNPELFDSNNQIVPEKADEYIKNKSQEVDDQFNKTIYGKVFSDDKKPTATDDGTAKSLIKSNNSKVLEQ